jgi:hypothetical protein
MTIVMTGFILPSLLLVVLILDRCNDDLDRRAPARSRDNRVMSPQHLYALSDPDQTEAGFGRGRCLGRPSVEASSIVSDGHDDLTRLTRDLHPSVRSLGILDDVGERLLHDPV